MSITGSVITMDRVLHDELIDLADRGFTPQDIYDAVVATWPATARIPSATSRFGDQHTSTAAGATHDSNDVARYSFESRAGMLLAVIIDNEGLTAHEATDRILADGVSPSAFEGCRRRVSDLLRAGHIEDSGITRINPGSDRDAIVWTATSAGRDAYRSMLETGWSK